MFKNVINYTLVALFLVTSASGAVNEPPADYRRFVESLEIESQGNYALFTLRLENGLIFYQSIRNLGENEIAEMQSEFASGREIFFYRNDQPGEFLLDTEVRSGVDDYLNPFLISGWSLRKESQDHLPRIVSIMPLKRSKNVPDWFSFAGAILTLSDGSSWRVGEGASSAWRHSQIGDSILICGEPCYLIMNVGRGHCSSELIERLH